jgi:hypothetical protein
MKLDMDLCREILFKVEELEPLEGWIQDLQIPSATESELTYHVRLLDEAGLIVAQDLSTMSGVSWKAKRLTWAGHDFLRLSRNETFWSKAKETALRTTGAVTLEVMKVVLGEVAKAAASAAMR